MERTITRALREERSVRNEIEKLMVLWCHTMHDQISWPRRGHYQCRRCGRCYPVPWLERSVAPVRAPAIPIAAGLEHARTA